MSGRECGETLTRGVSVIVPVFNSERVLPRLVERLEAVLRTEGIAHELILVNDGSRDRSWQHIVQAAGLKPGIRGIDLMKNYGQHNALLCGIRMARFDYVVTLDDDLQNPPEEIPKLLRELANGFDVVYGAPAREQHGPARNVASKFTKLALQSTMGARTARKVSSFRAFRTDLRIAFQNYAGSFVSIDVLLTWASSRFGVVTVDHQPRLDSVSNYTVTKLAMHALNMITGFSVVPLQVASVIGFLFTFFGSTVLMYVLGRYLISGTTVPGFPFLASIISVFAGAQLFALGIIGEYLARMHFRLMGRPAYAVREYIEMPSACSIDTAINPAVAEME